MANRQAHRELRHHHVEWWIVTAWASLGLVAAAGFTAAAGLAG